MQVKTVAVMSPGDMGHSVGQTIREHGLRVITCVAGRSTRTQGLAQQAGLELMSDMDSLVQEADLMLSILVPAKAVDLAQRTADALKRTGASLVYADCNAISPRTMAEVEALITGAGSKVVDASIVGGPPRNGYTPRIYASGEHADVLAQMNDYGLNINVMDDVIGHASALKMCFASLTKGSTALYSALMTTARSLGVDQALIAEFQGSMPERLASLERGIRRVPIKAHRFVGEMEEMEKTYADVGVPSEFFIGAADMYRLMAQIPTAQRTPEDSGEFPTLEETLDDILKVISSPD